MKTNELALRRAIAQSKSLTDVCKILNLSPGGDMFDFLRKRILSLNIDVSHFSKRSFSFNERADVNQIFVKNCKYSMNTVRKYAKRFLNYTCQQCKLKPIWNNGLLVLQLDHINGDRSDNRKENLRWLCPNCHSQTGNFSGKKNKWRIKPSELNPDWRHAPKLNLRKVDRPKKEILAAQLLQYNWTELGRLYGVSDNAVRKWARLYELK